MSSAENPIQSGAFLASFSGSRSIFSGLLLSCRHFGTVWKLRMPEEAQSLKGTLPLPRPRPLPRPGLVVRVTAQGAGTRSTWSGRRAPGAERPPRQVEAPGRGRVAMQDAMGARRRAGRRPAAPRTEETEHAGAGTLAGRPPALPPTAPPAPAARRSSRT